jgi:uncharacterized repeat protein (TIGR01451 family)
VEVSGVIAGDLPGSIPLKTALFIISLLTSVAFPASLHAEQHRATHLGNPATRFAEPLATAEDLRARFRDERLRPDLVEVLRQWGWPGKIEDLYRAARTSEVQEVRISVGTTMPFMSSRENGKPICLRNVLWAGKEPAPAYAFYFFSNGRKYRCVTPKACSNFYVEDVGPEPVPALALDCTAPSQLYAGRPLEACFTLRNPGTAAVPTGFLRFKLPQNAKLLSVTEGAAISPEEVTWSFTNLAPNAGKRFCATVSALSPGLVTFDTSVTGSNIKDEVSSRCESKIIGIPAILIDAIDLEDPVEVGKEVTYEVTVTNQGSAEATNVKLNFILPPNEEFVSGTGASPIHSGQAIATEQLPVLASKAEAVWRVIVKATKPGDVRFKIELTSDQFTKPIHEEESTLLY